MRCLPKQTRICSSAYTIGGSAKVGFCLVQSSLAPSLGAPRELLNQGSSYILYLATIPYVIGTTHKIKKELSICQSLLCLDLVSFPVLSQIKPQAPLLVVPFRQFL